VRSDKPGISERVVDPVIGSVIAGFRLESIVGRGGMGVVYRATELNLEREVALKLILAEFADQPGFRARFQREARLAAKIDHPHAVPVYQAGEWEGLPYIAMRYVDAIDLENLVHAVGALHPQHAAEIVSQVAQALDAAHARDLVHRDVKPENVLLEPRPSGPHAYLTDFGLSRAIASTSGLTKTGTWVGTIDFAAPEQLQAANVDARCDVYALGCVLYHAVTAHAPFERRREISTFIAHLTEPPPTIASRRPECPAAERLDAVVERALAKEPGDRYPSAGALAEDARAAAATAPPPDEALLLHVRS
jgi:serine/threonine protein kinase